MAPPLLEASQAPSALVWKSIPQVFRLNMPKCVFITWATFTLELTLMVVMVHVDRVLLKFQNVCYERVQHQLWLRIHSQEDLQWNCKQLEQMCKENWVFHFNYWSSDNADDLGNKTKKQMKIK